MKRVLRGLAAALLLFIAATGTWADIYVPPAADDVAPPPPQVTAPPDIVPPEAVPPEAAPPEIIPPEAVLPPDGTLLPELREGVTFVDSAGLFDGQFMEEMEARNQALLKERGFQIAVVTVKTTSGEDVVRYTQALFDSWPCQEDVKARSLLLLLSVDEADYCAVSGDIFDRKMPADMISRCLDEYLEPGFARGDYQEGVLKFYEAITAGGTDSRAPGYRA